MNNDYAGSECSEGCAGFEPLPGDPMSNYGICKRPGSPNHGFPVLRGRPCRSFVPRGSEAPEPVASPSGSGGSLESR